MADADSNDVKMADEASGEQTGFALTESDMECGKSSGTTESGDQLPSVAVTADDKMECDSSTDEKIVKPEETSKSITTDISDVAKDEMECEEIRDESISIDTGAKIQEESKETAEAGAESLAHSEKKDEMECEDLADSLQSEDSKSLLKESELPTDTELKLAKTSNDASVEALKLVDQEKDGMKCVLGKLQSEDATARNSSEPKSVPIEESASSNESSNEVLITGKKTASVDLSEFLGISCDVRKLPLPYSPSSGELADESNQSDSLSSASWERTRVENVKPVTHPEIAEDPNRAGPSSTTASTASSVYSSDTRKLTSHETTEAPKMSPSTFTSGSELVSVKNESQKPNDSVTELPETSTTSNAISSSFARFELIVPEDTIILVVSSDDTVDDTISVPVPNEPLHVDLGIKAEVEETEGAKPVHLSPKKPQTLQTEKHVQELSAEEEKSEISDAPGFQAEQEHSNVELSMKQDESVAATPEDVQSDVKESQSHVSGKRRKSVDEEHFGGPSGEVNKKQKEGT